MTNLRLNQVLAKEKGAKTASEGILTAVYQTVQKAPLFNGLDRTYEPRDDAGEMLPGESNRIQRRYGEELATAAQSEAELLNLVATKEAANQNARAAVVIDGELELPELPVSVLLTLEKRLVNYATLVKTLPGVDPAQEWTWDENERVYRTPPALKTRSKKIPRNHVKAAATDKHAEQVEVYYEDMVVGDWREIKFSGGITEKDRRALLTRIEKLAAAVKVAREQANLTEAPDVKIGQQVFEYLSWL